MKVKDLDKLIKMYNQVFTENRSIAMRILMEEDVSEFIENYKEAFGEYTSAWHQEKRSMTSYIPVDSGRRGNKPKITPIIESDFTDDALGYFGHMDSSMKDLVYNMQYMYARTPLDFLKIYHSSGKWANEFRNDVVKSHVKYYNPLIVDYLNIKMKKENPENFFSLSSHYFSKSFRLVGPSLPMFEDSLQLTKAKHHPKGYTGFYRNSHTDATLESTIEEALLEMQKSEEAIIAHTEEFNRESQKWLKNKTKVKAIYATRLFVDTSTIFMQLQRLKKIYKTTSNVFSQLEEINDNKYTLIEERYANEWLELINKELDYKTASLYEQYRGALNAGLRVPLGDGYIATVSRKQG